MEKYVEKNVNLHAFVARVLFRRRLVLIAVLLSLAAGVLLSGYFEKRRVSQANAKTLAAAEKAEEAELQESQKEADILGLTDLQRQKVQDAFRAYRVYKDAISKYSGLYNEALASKADLSTLHRKQMIYRVSSDNKTAVSLLVKKYLDENDAEEIRQIIAADLPGVNPRDLVSISDLSAEEGEEQAEDSSGGEGEGTTAAADTGTTEAEEENINGLFTTFICVMTIGASNEQCDSIGQVIEKSMMKYASEIRMGGVRIVVRPAYMFYESGLTSYYYHRNDTELTSLRNVYSSYVTLMNNVIDKFSLSESEYFNILCDSLKSQEEAGAAPAAEGQAAEAELSSDETAAGDAAAPETENTYVLEKFSKRNVLKRFPLFSVMMLLFALIIGFLAYLASDRMMTVSSLASVIGAPVLSQVRMEDMQPGCGAEKLAVSILSKDTETDPGKARLFLNKQLSSMIGSNSLKKISFWSDVDNAGIRAFIGSLTEDLKKNCPDTAFSTDVSVGEGELENLMSADGVILLPSLSESTYSGYNHMVGLIRNTNRPVLGMIVNNSPVHYKE